VLGLFARPSKEMQQPSWAATRWSVRAAPGPPAPRADVCRWRVERVACRKGQHLDKHRNAWGEELAQDARPQWILDWTYQVLRGTGTLHISPGLGCRTAAPQGPPAASAAHAYPGPAPARSRSA
jgi:hypothetical protein